MGTYLQQYGAGDERRIRIIKTLVFIGLGIIVLALIAYFGFHNYAEKQVVKRFLERLNAHDFEGAYREWGCTPEHPCPNYDFQRFLEDWGPSKKITSPWKIASVDGCKTFVTVNVQAEGSQLQSLGVERSDHSLGFAPAPECQEPKWHWRQFFNRIFHRGSPT